MRGLHYNTLIVYNVCRFCLINILNVLIENSVLFKMIATVHGGVNVNDEHIQHMKNIESPGMLELLFLAHIHMN